MNDLHLLEITSPSIITYITIVVSAAHVNLLLSHFVRRLCSIGEG
jgi:hypothetical protein